MENRWSYKEVQRKIGISSVVFGKDVLLGKNEIEKVKEVGIDCLEICGLYPREHYDYHNRTQITNLLKECIKQDVRIVSVHGPDVPYGNEYDEIQKAVIKETVLSAKVASDLGASMYIGHFGYSERSRKILYDVLNKTEDIGITLTIENIKGYSLPDLLEFVSDLDSSRLGITVDIGHAFDHDGTNLFVKKQIAYETMKLFGKYLYHVHLHDYIDRDHYAPFTGNIQWKEIIRALMEIDYVGELMFESMYPSQEEVLRMTGKAAFMISKKYLNADT